MYNLQAPFSIRKRVDAYTSTSICLTSHRLACPQTHTVRGKCSARSKSVPVWLCGKFCRHTSWSRSPLPPAPPGALQTEKGMLKIILTMTAKSAGVWEARYSNTVKKPRQDPEKHVNVPRSNGRARVAWVSLWGPPLQGLS